MPAAIREVPGGTDADCTVLGLEDTGHCTIDNTAEAAAYTNNITPYHDEGDEDEDVKMEEQDVKPSTNKKVSKCTVKKNLQIKEFLVSHFVPLHPALGQLRATKCTAKAQVPVPQLVQWINEVYYLQTKYTKNWGKVISRSPTYLKQCLKAHKHICDRKHKWDIEQYLANEEQMAGVDSVVDTIILHRISFALEAQVFLDKLWKIHDLVLDSPRSPGVKCVHVFGAVHCQHVPHQSKHEWIAVLHHNNNNNVVEQQDIICAEPDGDIHGIPLVMMWLSAPWPTLPAGIVINISTPLVTTSTPTLPLLYSAYSPLGILEWEQAAQGACAHKNQKRPRTHPPLTMPIGEPIELVEPTKEEKKHRKKELGKLFPSKDHRVDGARPVLPAPLKSGV
ncbi:hypothetical protein B0H14DRAFT_3518727 [Mycena olivaceomarginata]|nr:hypothetical protein B0H14DRAFT_3518727 [Mycena olivaceomarginata]